jgi:uncharacterized protein YecE (DUF72 family)
MARSGEVRVGIGGWIFEPWRGVFYPKGLKQADELAYASHHVTSIEINSTYYSTQKPESFARWAAAAPDGFQFSVKGSRFCTNRKVLGEAGPSIDKFLNQGLVELGDRLGPLMWQFMPTKRFEPDDFAAFLALLPAKHEGVALRHVVESRHESFADPAFVELCRKHGVAICSSENENYPLIADVTADFVYLRLLGGSDDIETCYPPAELDRWAKRLQIFAAGEVPDDLSPVAGGAPKAARDVYAYVIHSGKVRAPRAAMELLHRLYPDRHGPPQAAPA